MNNVIPQLYCPFPPEVNPHIHHARAHVETWVAESGVVRKQDSRTRFERADFAEFAAVTYPEADKQGIQLISDWFAWLFLVDDELDDGTAGRHLDQVRSLMNDILVILRSPGERIARTNGSRTAISSLADLWQRTFARSTPSWRRRFVRHVEDCFADACWEAENRVHGRIPSTATYIAKRRNTGAIYVCMDLIEIARGIELPVRVLHSQVFNQALDASCDVVCWTNDVYSLEKERSLGEHHNLAYLIEQERRLTTTEALAETANRISARTRQYLGHEKELLRAFPDRSTELTRYTAGMRSWMRGNLDWSQRTNRYQDHDRSIDESGATNPHVYLEPALLGNPTNHPA